MKKPLAILVLGCFALLFLAAAWWGLSDVRSVHAKIENCISPLIVDQGSFWMMGSAAIAVLPFLAVTSSPKIHRLLFSFLIVFFLVVPILGYMQLISKAEGRNYHVSGSLQLLLFSEVQLISTDCQK